jgi:hypothetical protein
MYILGKKENKSFLSRKKLKKWREEMSTLKKIVSERNQWSRAIF